MCYLDLILIKHTILSDKNIILTSISWPIQAIEALRYTAHKTENATQIGETASVRYDTDPRTGILTNDSAACSNHLKLYFSNVSQCYENIGLQTYRANNSAAPLCSTSKCTPKLNH